MPLAADLCGFGVTPLSDRGSPDKGTVTGDGDKPSEATDMRYCEACGAGLLEGAAFCGACGGPVASRPPERVMAATPPPPSPGGAPRTRGTRLLIAGSLAAVLLAAAVAAVVTLLLVWAGGGWSRDSAVYIPEEVAGKPVDPSSAFARSVTDALADPAVEEVSSGAVGGGGTGADALPELILAAAETKDPEATRKRLEKDVTQLESKVETTDVEGVQVQIFNVSGGQGKAGSSFAFASPDEAIVLWSIAFADGQENALAGMEAMLQAGKNLER